MSTRTEHITQLNIDIIENYFKQYKDFKKYVQTASDEEKRTKRYKFHSKLVEDIEQFYAEASDIMKVIIDNRYWYPRYQAEWADLADDLGMKTSKVRAYRKLLIEQFAERISWI